MRTNPIAHTAAFFALFAAGCGKTETTNTPPIATSSITKPESNTSIAELDALKAEYMKQKVKIMINELNNFSMAYYLDKKHKTTNEKIDILVSNEDEKTAIKDVIEVLKRISGFNLTNRINVIEVLEQVRESNTMYHFSDLYFEGQNILEDKDQFPSIFWSNTITRNKMSESKIQDLPKSAG